MKEWPLLIQLMPLLNLLLLPFARSMWRFHKRLMTLEVNQKRVCEHLKITRVEVE